MSTTSMVIFSNPLFASYSVYARNASNVLSRPVNEDVHRLDKTLHVNAHLFTD